MLDKKAKFVLMHLVHCEARQAKCVAAFHREDFQAALESVPLHLRRSIRDAAERSELLKEILGNLAWQLQHPPK